MALIGPRRALLGSSNLSWLPRADGAVPSWYAAFTTSQYYYTSPRGNFSSWLTALGGTFSRASTASYYNSAGVLSSAANDTLRFDYDPVTLAPKGILLEGARTNLLTYSQTFSDASWSKQDISVSSNAGTAPDGTNTASKLVEANGGSVNPSLYRAFIPTNGVTYTYSVFAKKAERTRLNFYNNAAAGLAWNCTFDLNSGTATGTGASILNVGNGWFLCSVTVTSTGVDSSNIQNRVYPAAGGLPYAGDGTSGLYVWGAQLEAGAFASSYIPTTSGTVTRAADSLTFPTSPWFNASAGTVFVEASPYTLSFDSFPRAAAFSNGTLANEISVLFYQVAPAAGGSIRLSNVVQSDLVFTISGLINKIMHAFANNDAAVSVNGGAALTDNSVTLPTVNIMNVGSGGGGGGPIYGHIRKIGYWPFRVTNAGLQRLTAA